MSLTTNVWSIIAYDRPNGRMWVDLMNNNVWNAGDFVHIDDSDAKIQQLVMRWLRYQGLESDNNLMGHLVANIITERDKRKKP